MTAREPWHPFRSAASKQEYLAFYDARAQHWPIPSESTMVGTTFGDTFVLSDEDWQRLAVPTLLLVGRNDVVYSGERAVQRLAAVAPRVKTAITDGDHHLTITRPDWVIQHVMGFLADH